MRLFLNGHVLKVNFKPAFRNDRTALEADGDAEISRLRRCPLCGHSESRTAGGDENRAAVSQLFHHRLSLIVAAPGTLRPPHRQRCIGERGKRSPMTDQMTIKSDADKARFVSSCANWMAAV
jgi:hypothetical protein